MKQMFKKISDMKSILYGPFLLCVYSGSISLLRVFFRESTIMQYKRDELFTWEDFVCEFLIFFV